VLVDHFDFDGAADLMVPASTGYGGVNGISMPYLLPLGPRGGPGPPARSAGSSAT
jgi:hypothetical protein